ncbi:MAG: efflux RND transporter periplasmic adaptor subunit [Saprospiraceae bacterium]|nr:efflux RND transporter periplasmic adaptor subunit [Saprospiraceae bacterium]
MNLQQARYKGLKAELELLGISVKTLENTGEIQSSISFYAPVNGYITKVNINNGKLVSPNDLLFEIVDRSHVHLELQVFAKDVPNSKKVNELNARCLVAIAFILPRCTWWAK